VTFAVLAPERRFLQCLGLAACVVVASGAWAHDAKAARALVEDAPDPSSPDSADGDLGAIDDGPDQPELPDAEVEPEPAQPDDQADQADPSDDEADDEPDFDEADFDEADFDEADDEPVDDDEPGERIRPPRVDGPYVGVLAFGSANFVNVIGLDTPGPLLGGGGMLQAGDAVFPWMSIGVAAGAQFGTLGAQRMFEGALLVELAFLPVHRYPLSIRTGFGFGGGSVREQGIDRRFGFGGALFKGSLRYELFPLAARKRPDRGGGWALGPELGWLGATPSAKGQPFVHTLLLGISTSFYFGS
jgi:hypothetical protein